MDFNQFRDTGTSADIKFWRGVWVQKKPSRFNTILHILGLIIWLGYIALGIWASFQ